MKNRTSLATLILAGVSPFVLATAANAEPVFARGRIIVEPQAGLTADEFDKDVKIHGGGKTRKLGQSNIYVMDVPHGSEKAIANKLGHNPHFKYAELDQRVEFAATSNDPYLGSEWHLNKIGATTAWDKTQGAGVTIAILDSGVDASHPDLAGRMVAGYNFYDGNTNTADVCGHGTKVAGSAAATLNNAAGVAGVAGQAKIMPLRIAYNSSGTCYGWLSDIANGVTYAADHGVRIANISYAAMPATASVVSAASYMKSKGGLVFVSAGNLNKDEGYSPTTSMIAVSATDSADNRSSFSSYGAFVSLSAPGSGIYTTVQGGGYGAVSGTSFASPVAAAVGALVMSANPSLTAAQVENILFTTAVDLGTAGRDIYFGYGRVNAAAAVQKAGGTTTIVTDTTRPTVVISSPGASSTVSGTATVTAAASDNVGVSRVDLKVNSTVIASDTAAPYSFAWDTKGAVNGLATLTAIAYDAAGNVTSSSPVSVNVANSTTTVQPVTDTIKPTVKITNPVAGSVHGNVNVTVSASDNMGSAGITTSLYIDGRLMLTGVGSSLSYNWGSNQSAKGNHTLQAVSRDKAGNTSSASVIVNR